jgi:hypothetical protein
MTQFPKVSTTRGAPMGRSQSGYLETNYARVVRLFQVRLDTGGYDDGGAYWGTGAPLYCAQDVDGNRQFTRAASRMHAALILGIPAGALISPLGDWAAFVRGWRSGARALPAGVTMQDVTDWAERCAEQLPPCEGV